MKRPRRREEPDPSPEETMMTPVVAGLSRMRREDAWKIEYSKE